MKLLQINTTQNVPINFELANVGQRLFAFILDNAIKFSYIFLVSYFLGDRFFAVFEEDFWSQKGLIVILYLPATVYTLVSEIAMNGQTLGKRLMKIRVINIDGFRPSVSDYLIRWFLRLVDFHAYLFLFIFVPMDHEILGPIVSMFGTFTVFVGLLFIAMTKTSQRIGDIFARTIVISLQDKTRIGHTILENLKETYRPSYPAVIKLSDNDARIIKENYRKAVDGKDDQTMLRLKNKIIEVTQIVPVHDDNRVFVKTVLKDYSYYTQDM